MKMGIEAGILPWPKSFPLKVETICYRKARNAAKTSRERGSDAVATLRRLIDQPRQVVAVASAGNKPTKVTRRTVAIRFIKDDQKKFGILDDALLRILGSRKAKAIFTAELGLRQQWSKAISPPLGACHGLAAVNVIEITGCPVVRS
jgi:hypothetical protein